MKNYMNNNRDASLILHAVRIEDIVTVERLVQQDQSLLEFKDPRTGNTPLHEACFCPSGSVWGFRVVKFLLDRGASVNSINNAERGTPLHFATSIGNLAVVKILLDRGASVHSTNYTGNTPLHEACISGNFEVVEVLLDRGASINSTNDARETPLQIASMRGDLDMVELLVEKGADLDVPLFLASRNGHSHVIDFLAERRASSLEAKNEKGNIVDENVPSFASRFFKIELSQTQSWFIPLCLCWLFTIVMKMINSEQI